MVVSDEVVTGTQTATFSRDVERDGDLYRVVSIDEKGERTVIGRGLSMEEAQKWLLGKHPMTGRKVGPLPDTRFDREILEDP